MIRRDSPSLAKFIRGSLAGAALLLLFASHARAITPCCAITAIDAGKGIVTSRVNSTGQTFQFAVKNAATLSSLKIGQPIFANFTAKQVSLDGRTACCNITAFGAAPAAPSVRALEARQPSQTAPQQLAPAVRPVAPRPSPGAPGAAVTSPPAKAPATPNAGALVGAARGILSNAALPLMTAGEPRPVSFLPGQAPPLPFRFRARVESRTLSATLGGRSVNASVVHVRGVDGFEKVAGLPEGVKNLLAIHVRKLPKGDSDHYIINVSAAQEWIKTHPVPADVKPTDVKTSGDHSGCNSFSWHCAEEAAKHAEDEATRQADMLRDQATQDWHHATKELAKEWDELESCMSDHTLHMDNIPVRFSIAPQMNVDAQRQGQTNDGSASGQITGTLGLGLPVVGDFTANLDVFYIPCLPFVVRPKSMGADGTMSLTTKLTASLNASGRFDKSFPIPPSGGASIPVEVIPIVIGGVPVAELDISVYFDGGIEVGGEGQLTGSFEMDDPHETAFNFNCSGQGCISGRPPRTSPAAPTTTETYRLEGKVFVIPRVYAALEMNFDVDAATVRAGPEPSLIGTVYGCGTATQTTNLSTGASATTESHALAFDLDWKMILRTEFLVGGMKEGSGWNPTLVGTRHIWFKDLWPGGSNALIVGVTPAPQLTGVVLPGQFGPHTSLKTSTLIVKMPACYPFADSMHYTVALPAAATGVRTSQCSWTGAQGFCTGDPTRALAFTVAWPASGTYALSVVAAEDTHLRTFTGVAPTPVSVSVE